MDLQKICEEVEREYEMSGLSDGLYADFAKEVARRAVILKHEKSETRNHDLFDDVITKIKFEPLSRQQQYDQLGRIIKAERKECLRICKDVQRYHEMKSLRIGIKEDDKLFREGEACGAEDCYNDIELRNNL